MFCFEKQLLWLLQTFLNNPSLCNVVLAMLGSFNRKRGNYYEWNKSETVAKLKRTFHIFWGVIFAFSP